MLPKENRDNLYRSLQVSGKLIGTLDTAEVWAQDGKVWQVEEDTAHDLGDYQEFVNTCSYKYPNFYRNLHAWFSQKSADLFGYFLYKNSKGELVQVSVVSNDFEYADTFKWDDKVYRGIVVKFVERIKLSPLEHLLTKIPLEKEKD